MSYNVQYSTISLCSSSCGSPLVTRHYRIQSLKNIQYSIISADNVTMICKVDSRKQ